MVAMESSGPWEKYPIRVRDLSQNIYKTWPKSHEGPGRWSPYCMFRKLQLWGMVGSLMSAPRPAHKMGWEDPGGGQDPALGLPLDWG